MLPVNVRPCDRDVEVPLADDPVTAKVMDLFNVAYEILLQILERFFAHTDETDAQLKTLADATMGLMFGAIKPLGDLITTLPAGPSYPGANAGPSFELFYESDYLLPHRDAAWALLTERLDVAAAFCQEIVTGGQSGQSSRPVPGAARPARRVAHAGWRRAGRHRAGPRRLPARRSDPPRRRSCHGGRLTPGAAGDALRARPGQTGRAAGRRRGGGLADVFDRTLGDRLRPGFGGPARGGRPRRPDSGTSGCSAGLDHRPADHQRSPLRPLTRRLPAAAPVPGLAPPPPPPGPCRPPTPLHEPLT